MVGKTGQKATFLFPVSLPPHPRKGKELKRDLSPLLGTKAGDVTRRNPEREDVEVTREPREVNWKPNELDPDTHT